MTPPAKGLTCCTLRPNVPALYICTTSVAREVTDPFTTRSEHCWSKGPLAGSPLMGGAPSQITAHLRAPHFAPMRGVYVRPITTPRVGATWAAGYGH